MTGKKLTLSSSSSSSCCCISHEFSKAATKNPNKIAVIHASGGARIAREFRNSTRDSGTTASDLNYDKFYGELLETAPSSRPPVYDGDRCFTFAEILSAVDSFSYRLRRVLDDNSSSTLRASTGIEQSTEDQDHNKPKLVGICMEPSVEYIVAVLSVLRCGEAFIPLDPLWPTERISSIVSFSYVDVIIRCQSSFDGTGCVEMCESLGAVYCSSCPELFISMEENLRQKFGSASSAWPCEREKSRSYCYVLFTSGSTGKPKGVCGTEIGLLNRFLWMQEFYPLGGEELLLFKTSISFIDHLQEFLGALLTTCTLVIPPFNEIKENSFYVHDFLQAYAINRLIAVPSLMRVILPALDSPYNIRVQSSLKILVLSGEVFPVSLWEMISKLLPKTTILNLYGSTEVSGDCSYFDCKRLLSILESETLDSVPIGMPISNSDLVLVGEDSPMLGEIYVGGLCIAKGYYGDVSALSQEFVKSPICSSSGCLVSDLKCQYYFRTGDFAQLLQSGDLVFMGRKDRTLKVNGQRIALEEVESALLGYPGVVDTAVVSHRGQGEVSLLEAHLVMKQKDIGGETLRASIRSWMLNKLPSAMIPSSFFFSESLPVTSTGKVDYARLACMASSMKLDPDKFDKIQSTELLQVIKKAFCDALMVEMVSDDDDFFKLGGDSISAAHVSYSLEMDMRMLYIFPSPMKLQMALMGKEGLRNNNEGTDANLAHEESLLSNLKLPVLHNFTPRGSILRLCDKTDNFSGKRQKVDSDYYRSSMRISLGDGYPWDCNTFQVPCSFSRCNKLIYEGSHEGKDFCQKFIEVEIPRNKRVAIKEVWKVHMESCIDASPLVVLKDQDVFVFIGSHSFKFLCINAKSGFVQWETKLEGRIECSAAIIGDFSQVVVGCYRGIIYFIDFYSGSICWHFETCGEVKCQPVVDQCRNLVWCGSHDCHLYALDYRRYWCVYKLSCGGSIFGSPAIDEVRNTLYVASTSGRVTAISIKPMPFSEVWLCELEAPVFGSLSIFSQNGNVLCCLVDGHVIALDAGGSTIWKVKTGGPIFAGPCTSYALPSQALICSRDGRIYSFELEKGGLLWEHNLGDPITSSAYVDENLQLVSSLSHLSERLICVCTSSGSVYVLCIPSDSDGDKVREVGRLDLQGNIFSSPVMIGGRIFVGCRDDYMHCLQLKSEEVNSL